MRIGKKVVSTRNRVSLVKRSKSKARKGVVPCDRISGYQKISACLKQGIPEYQATRKTGDMILKPDIQMS